MTDTERIDAVRVDETMPSEEGTVRRHPDRRPRSVVVRTLLSLGLVLGLGSVGTMALWSSSAKVSPGGLTAAQLDISVNDGLTGTASRDATRTEANWTMNDMLPGEQRAFSITVGATAESIPVDVRASGYATGTLGPALRVSIFLGGTPTNTGGSLTAPAAGSFRTATCAGGTLIGAGGVSLGSDAAKATVLDATKRRLNAGGSMSYCLVVRLDDSAATRDDARLRNARATATIMIRGTQEGAP